MPYGDSPERLAQYAAFGRFVVAFEHMVEAARRGAEGRLTAGNSSLHQRLVHIVLNHSALSAIPLMELFRSLCAEIFKEPSYGWKPEESKPLLSALKQAASDYEKLARTRNIIVHGTWFFYSSEPGNNEMKVGKYKATARGFAAEDGPTSADELLALARECGEVARLITAIDYAILGPFGRGGTIRQEGGRWVTALSGSDFFTDILPFPPQYS